MTLRYIVAALLCTYAFASHADGNAAVAGSNGNAGAGYVEGGTVHGSVGANIPVADMFGIALSARIADYDGGDAVGGSVGFFARDMKVGYAGVVGSLDERGEGGDPRTRGLEARGVLYLDMLDVFASWARYRTRYDSSVGRRDRFTPGWLGLGFFAMPDARLSFSVGFDDADDLYDFSIVVQPDFLYRESSIAIGLTDGDNAPSTVSASFHYYFGAPRSLRERYREDTFPLARPERLPFVTGIGAP